MRQSGLSQTALADKAGVSRATVNRLKHGRQDAEQQTIKRLARAMRYPFPDFDVVFPEAAEGSVKRDSEGPDAPQAGRSVRESGSGYTASGAGEEDAAYLRTALEVSRALSNADQENLPLEAKLRLIDLAEKVMVPVYGKRAKTFLDEERARLRGGEDGGGSGSP